MKNLSEKLKSLTAGIVALSFFMVITVGSCSGPTSKGEDTEETTEAPAAEAAESDEHPSSDEGGEHPTGDEQEADSTASEHPSNS